MKEENNWGVSLRASGEMKKGESHLFKNQNGI